MAEAQVPGFSAAAQPVPAPTALTGARAAAHPAAPGTPSPPGLAAPLPAAQRQDDRPARRAPRTGTLGISAGTVLALGLLWFAATNLGWVKPLFLPSPQAVYAQFADYLSGRANDHPLWQHLLASQLRVLSAFGLACLTAIPLGIAMGLSRWVRGVADPVLEFYRPLPPLSYLPLIIIWFGIDELPKVLLIYLSCFAPLALAARAGVGNASAQQRHAAQSLGATPLQLVRHVILPAALPDILVGMRIALGFGWTTLVAAEMVAASLGLGQMVLNASNFLRTDIVVMGILLIGVIACLYDLSMRLLQRRLAPWHGRA